MAHGDAPTIKLILTDIDDTVMPRGMTAVSERTVRAFRAARDAGITVGPSSGRGRAQIAPFFRNDEACFSTAITTNGLEIYAAGEKIAEHRLPTASLEQALSLVSASPRTGMLYFEGSQPYLVVGDREVLGLTMPGYAARCIDADGLPATPVLKANIFLDADFDETAAFAAMLNERVDGLDFDVPLPGYLNIMPSGWNKGSAVLALCEHLGIGTDEVAVFGDAGNDLAMFHVVENSVAVANATPEAAAAARWHIGACADDAVAASIEALAAGEWPFTA